MKSFSEHFIFLLAFTFPFIACIRSSEAASLPQNSGSPGIVLTPEYPDSSATVAFPLKKGPAGSRYLTGQDGKPFLWAGDAAWSLIAQLSREEVIYYLDDRMKKGFSVLMVNLIEHKFSTHAPANYYGDKPFSGDVFTTPNEKYFAFADFVIREAQKREYRVLLAPLYLGYDCGDEGWCDEARAASSEDMLNWGRYVGSRYRSFSNIVWLIGGDTDPLKVRKKHWPW